MKALDHAIRFKVLASIIKPIITLEDFYHLNRLGVTHLTTNLHQHPMFNDQSELLTLTGLIC